MPVEQEVRKLFLKKARGDHRGMLGAAYHRGSRRVVHGSQCLWCQWHLEVDNAHIGVLDSSGWHQLSLDSRVPSISSDQKIAVIGTSITEEYTAATLWQLLVSHKHLSDLQERFRAVQETLSQLPPGHRELISHSIRIPCEEGLASSLVELESLSALWLLANRQSNVSPNLTPKLALEGCECAARKHNTVSSESVVESC